MKLSLALTAAILVIAVFFGVKDRQRLVTVRERHRQLVGEARALGLATKDLLDNGKSQLPSKISRTAAADREDEAKAFAAELAAFANEMKRREETGEEGGEAFQKQIFGLIEKMLQLDATQLKVLIDELRVLPDVDDEMRRNIVGFAIMTLASDHPKAALALFTESSDLFEGDTHGERVISSALAQWAKDDPMAALEWIRVNQEKHPDLVTDEAKLGVISGAARQDPKLAFRLIGELGLKDAARAAQKIGESAHGDTARTEVLEALRGRPEGGDPKEERNVLTATLGGLAQTAAGEGFESVKGWLDSANLSAGETQAVVSRLSPWQTKEDTGRWIEWMQEKLPPDQLSSKVTEMVSQWTQNDYKAAGNWLNGAADGPAKESAVKSYAATVAPYDAPAAAQWALTLPAGTPRVELLESIHEAWKDQDQAAAAAFARKHGLAE